MRPRHPVAVPVVLALLVGVVAGCGGISERRVGAEDLRFFVHGRTVLPSGGMDAQVVGTLATADGCLLLEEGGSRYPVVWPGGTAVVDTTPLVIALPSGERLHLGDRVSGSGGYLTADDVGIDVPDACLDEFGEVAVFNADDVPRRTQLP